MIGQQLKQVDTPALIIDADRLEANIRTMADFFAGRATNLRPHTKTHKCSTLARKQIDAGARGVTCAKLGEAEVMADAGIRDILIANQIVGPIKIARLMALAKRSDVIVAVDDAANVRQLAEAAQAAGVRLNVIIEIEVGMNRCGVEARPPVVDLAKLIASSDGLSFRGVMGYEGHAVGIEDRAERERVTGEANSKLLRARDLIVAAGLPVEIVSAGGSGTYDISGSREGITEIQAGSYATMDVKYKTILAEFECALSVLATVISRPAPDRIITDAGLKAFSTGWGMPVPLHRIDIEYAALSEEHGRVNVLDASCGLKPGDKERFIVTHGCTANNLHDRFYIVRNCLVEDVWPIDARGRGA